MPQKQFWMPCRFHEALSAPAREKLALGVEFKRIFRFGEESEPTPEQQKEAVAAVAKMYRQFEKEELREINMLDPGSIENNALHNIMLGRLGMDLGQMTNVKTKDNINSVLIQPETTEDQRYGMKPVDHCTNTQATAKTIGSQTERLCELYAGRDTEQKGIRQAAVGVLYADQMARYYGKPLSQLSLEDNQIAISLGSMCNDSKEELGKFFNGEEARLGSISQTYKTVMAAHTMKQIQAA